MLTLKELWHVEVLGKSASMAEAAARCGLTQSAISQSLSGIEEKLGVQLFVRSHKAIAITRFGEVFLARARRILNELDKLYFDIDALKNDHLGTVRFGVGPAVADFLLVETLRRFSTDFPGAVPRFRVKLWEDSESFLLNEDIDLYLGGFRREARDPRFAFTPFYKDRLIAVARKGHPLWERERIHTTDLIRYPVLAQDASNIALWPTMEAISDLELLNLNMPASVMANPMEALPVLEVTDQVLLCLRANWLKVATVHPGLAELPVVDMRGMAHMKFVTRAGHQPSAAQRALVSCFRDLAGEMLKPLEKDK
ncbi:MAG: LysR family transcriptional regulator [Parahaliea sp.]